MRRVLQRAVLSVLVVLASALTVPRVVSAGPDEAWTEYRREGLKDLAARRAKAEQRIDDATAFFAGKLPQDDAFPQLMGVPLDAYGSVEGRLRLLEDTSGRRAIERTTPVEDLGSDSRRTKVSMAIAATIDAEEGADALERRVLISYRALLRQHPQLGAEAVGEALAPLEAEIQSIRADLPTSSGEARAALELRLGRTEADRAEYSGLVRDLRWSLLAGGDDRAAIESGLAEWVRDVDLVRARSEFQAAEAEVAAARDRAGNLGSDDELAEADSITPAEVARLPEVLIARQLELERAGELLSTAPEGSPGSPEAARFEALLLRRRAAAKRVEATDILLMEIEVRHVATAAAREEARKARDAEEHALREAAAAKSAAQGAVGRQRAEHQLRLAELQSRAGDAWVVTEAAENETGELRAGRVEELEAVRLKATRIPGLSDSDREEAAASIHRELRRFVTQLRAAAVEAQGHLVEVRDGRDEALADLEDASGIVEAATAFAAKLPVEDEATLKEAIGAARESGDREREALESRVESAQRYVDATLTQLEDAKRLQTTIRPLVPRSVLSEDRAYLLRDLQLELELVAPNLVNSTSRRVAAATDFTGAGVFTRAWHFVLGTFWVVLAIAGWVFLRRRADAIARLGLERLAARTSRLYRAALMSIAAEATPTVRSAIDLAVAIVLARGLHESLPEVALVLFTGAQFSLYRVLVGSFSLAVVKQPSIRPAIASLGPAAHAVAVSAARAVGFWLVARGFVNFVTVELLRTDALRQVLVLLLDVGFGFACLALLHRFEPVSRAVLSTRSGASSALMRPLISEISGPGLAVRWLRGLIGAVILSVTATSHFVQNIASEGSLLGRALNRIARYRMTRETGEEVIAVRPAPEEAREQLLAVDCDPSHRVGRPSLDRALDEAIAGWETDRSRGIAALIGNRGDGERTWLDGVQERLQMGREVRRIELQQRYTDVGALCETLGAALGVGAHRDVDSLAAAVDELPESVILFEEAQWAFLRAVHGLRTLRALLDLLSRTSSRHFWIVSIHRPSYQYLSRLGSLLKFDMFRTVLEVPPMGESQLRELIGSRIRAAGWTLDFAGLARPTPLAGDPKLEVERAETAFYRLLAESSEGNPGAALRQFVGCLHLADEGARVLTVRVGDALGVKQVTEADTTDLFTLAALRVHKRLTPMELARVNNMSFGLVRASLQHLTALGVIEQDESVRISSGWVPGVARTLRRQHFLHWSE